jgi:predicted XRE-type DNA-binding protein
MNEFTQANAQVLKAASEQLASGKMSSEDFDKLLNTLARFEERVTAIPENPRQ